MILAVIAFAVAANACYTGGWIALGLAFAVTVTLAPIALVALAAIVTAAAQWLGMPGAFPS